MDARHISNYTKNFINNYEIDKSIYLRKIYNQ